MHCVRHKGKAKGLIRIIINNFYYSSFIIQAS